jgi:predicted histone-like DNA-binding protein
MGLEFKPIAIKRIDKPDVVQYMPRLVGSGESDIYELAKIISTGSTFTEADCIGVLHALQQAILQELCMGKSIKLDRIGTLRLSIKSTAAATPEAVTVRNITKVNTIFKPSKEFTQMVNRMDISKQIKRKRK